MTAKIEVLLSAKDAAMVAAWQRTKTSVDKFENELKKIGPIQRRNKRETKGFFSAGTKGIAQMVAGYASLGLAIATLKQANQEFIQQTEEAGKKIDENFRKFRVQSGLRGLQGEAAQKRILDIAERQAVPTEQAAAAATQLVSSGFSAKQASGASLEEFLRILSASNVVGANVNPAELAKATASFLNSQKLDLNAKNLALVGRGVQSLFKSTNIQLGDLTEFSKVSKTLTGALTVREQLGSLSAVVQSFPAAEASTGIRNTVLKLQSAADDRTKVRALKELGLKPGAVDFVGENLDTVLQRLDRGFKSVPKEREKPILKTLFGLRSAAVAKTLIDSRAAIRKNVRTQGNSSKFLSDVEESTSGRNAASRRQQVALDRRRAAQDDEGDLLLSELNRQSEQAGSTPFDRSLQRGVFNTLRFLGASSKTAGAAAFTTTTNRDVVSRATSAVARRKAGAGEQEALVGALKETTAALKERPQATEVRIKVDDRRTKADVSPPAERPSKQLEDR